MAAPNPKRAYFWSQEETEFFILTMKELKVVNILDGKKHRNADLCKTVAERLKAASFPELPGPSPRQRHGQDG